MKDYEDWTEVIELADKSGVITTAISRLESGERKSTPRVLKAIAPFLGISYEELMMQAGYIDHVIDRDKFDLPDRDYITFFDIYQKAKNIHGRDAEVLTLVDMAVNQLSQQELSPMRDVLICSLDNRIPDYVKTVISTILEKFIKR